MSVKTTADEHIERAREHVHNAFRELGKVIIERDEMQGAKDFKDGYVKNLFRRSEALLEAFDGDPEGEEQASKIPSV